MANVNFYSSVDMSSFSVWFGYVTGVSTSSISLSSIYGQLSSTYYGSFKFSPGLTKLVGGTLTGYKHWSSGTLTYEVSGLSASATAVKKYIDSADARLLDFVLSGADEINGSIYADVLKGFKGNDALYGATGGDAIDGGDGRDTAVFIGPESDYSITWLAKGQAQVSSATEGEDTLTNIELLQFSDKTVDINFYKPNSAPVAKSPQITASGTEGKAFSFSVTKNYFTDADKTDKLTYSVTDLPSWMTFNSITNKFTGVPTYDAADSQIDLTLTATDTHGAYASASLFITVKNVSAIKGTAKSDLLTAGLGNDTLSGGLGNDELTGGAGADRFLFDTKLDVTNVDRITDFESGIDVLALKAGVFSKLKGDKDLSDNVWIKAVGEQSTLDYLVLDSDTGAFYYDADGSGAGVMIQFSTLLGVSEIGAAELLIV